jgi:septum formation protein
MQPSQFILASVSPRRRDLLRQIGLRFHIMPSTVDETIDEQVPPEMHVRILAERKARDVAFHLSDGIILGADTIVVLGDEILTKPADPAEAVRMLQRLSGEQHQVYTGFTLLELPSWRSITEVECTDVWFRKLDPDEILRYVESGSPLDKAGAYGIQDDFGAVFVSKVCGDFYNVVGLPLSRFYCAFTKFVKDGHPAHEE